MQGFKTIDDVEVTDKRVLVRVDLNVPLLNGKISDFTRIRRAATTIIELLDRGAKVIVMSHFGRPRGKFDLSMSLGPIADGLSVATGREVKFAVDCVGKEAEEAVARLHEGQLLCLENLRFYAAEENNDPEFARSLAKLGEIYVNDAFSCSHRAHASVVGITEFLPSVAGRLMEEELGSLEAVLGSLTLPPPPPSGRGEKDNFPPSGRGEKDNFPPSGRGDSETFPLPEGGDQGEGSHLRRNLLPNPPPPLPQGGEKNYEKVAAIIGGSKISSKLELLQNLIAKVDVMIIGGGMANTFLKAQGFEIGRSICEDDLLPTAKLILQTAVAKGCEIVLPVDAVVVDEFKAFAESRIVGVEKIGSGMMLDVGPKTIGLCAEKLAPMKTIIWNGPMGAFELPPFDCGTVSLARVVAALDGVRTVAGGGDTVAALKHAAVAESFTYISTAGGAFLEWLEGKELPGVAALRHNTSTHPAFNAGSHEETPYQVLGVV